MAREKQKRTFISRAFNPPRANVRHLVFIAAGQQNGITDDQPSRLTGQPDNWKDRFDRNEMDDFVPLAATSLPRRLVENTNPNHPNRRPEDTFLGIALDARFSYGFTPNNKQEIENAYFDWLTSKFDPNRIRSIYLAGHSRGGCLVYRLAARMNAAFPTVPIIVHGFDPVCDHLDQEFGVIGFGRGNPLAVNDPPIPKHEHRSRAQPRVR